jgi:hypothetical protein
MQNLLKWPKINWVSGDGWRIATPAEKMPNCPVCEEDELSLINEHSIFCNACNTWFNNDHVNTSNHRISQVTTC